MAVKTVCWTAMLALVLGVSGCGADSAQTSIEKSRTALDKGEYQAASIHVKNALKLEPQSGPARFLMGRLLFAGGDLKGAEIELHRALDNGYPADEVEPLRAQILLAQADFAKLVADFSKLKLKSVTGQVDLSASLASAYLSLGQTDQAQSLVTANLASAPGHVPTRLVQARLAASKRDFDTALKILDDTAATGVQRADVWRLQGDLRLYGKRDREGAKAAYRKALEVAPFDLYSSSQLVGLLLLDGDIKAAKDVYAAAAKAHPLNPQTKVLEANLALAEGNYTKARELLAPLLGAQKDDVSVLLLAGITELQLNGLARAEQHLRRALAINPSSPDTRRLLATVYLRRGEAGLAMDMLRPLMEADPNDAVSLALAAEAQLTAGQLQMAEALFARAARLNPKDVKSLTARAMIQNASGKGVMALDELQRVAASDPGTLADMALVSARLRAADIDGALTAIDALEKKMPQRALPADLRGRVMLLKHDLPKARASFELALTREPSYVPAAVALAKADVAEGKPEAAVARYENVLKAAPRNVGALVALSGLKARQNARAEEVTELLGRAIASETTSSVPRVLLVEYWLARSNPKQALEAAQAGLAAMPEDPALMESLSRAQLATGQTAQAVSTLSQLALLQPSSVSVQLQLAQAYYSANNSAGAEQALRQALSMAPDLLEAQRALMVLAVQGRKPDRALQIAREVQQRRPKAAVGHLLEGDVYVATKQWDPAIKAYRTALQGQGAGPAAARLYAVLNVHRSKAEADRFAEEWLRQQPKDTQLRLLLAQDAAKAGQLDVAQRRYSEIIAINPNDATATNDLAWLLMKTKQPGALAAAERAVALAPDNAMTLDTLASVLAADNKVQRAIDVSKSAVQLAPDAAALRLNLAKLYLQIKDSNSARQELNEIAKGSNRSAEFQEATELLKTL